MSASPNQIDAMMDAVIARFGRIDVLVNNAAGNFASPDRAPVASRRGRCLEYRAARPFYCTLALGKRWIAEKQPGTMLNIVATYVPLWSGFVTPLCSGKGRGSWSHALGWRRNGAL